MKIREAVYKFMEGYSKGIPSDDTRLRPRRVYSALLNSRARVLADALPDVSEHNYYTLPCVPLEETTAHQCGCIPVEGCFYYKTKCDLPESITKGKMLISDVTTLDGTIRFSQIEWNQIKYTQYDKFTAKDPKYFIRNNTLFLVNVPKKLKVISIRGLFEDISDVSEDCYLCEREEENCIPALDREFPVDRKYFNRICQLTRFELFGIQGTNDKEPNNQED